MAQSRVYTAIKDVGYIAANASSGMKNVSLGNNSVVLQGCAVASTGYSIGVTIEIYSRATPGSTYQTLRHVATIKPVLQTNNRLATSWTGADNKGATGDPGALPVYYADSDALQQLHFLLANTGGLAASIQVTWFYQIAQRAY